MKLDITKSQLTAIIEMADTMEATIGGGGDIDSPDLDNYDKETKKQIKLIDRFLSKNGYKR